MNQMTNYKPLYIRYSSEEWTNLNIGAKTKLGLTFTSASECW